MGEKPTKKPSSRAQLVSMGCAVTPASSWPADLVGQVADELSKALLKDIQTNPIPKKKSKPKG